MKTGEIVDQILRRSEGGIRTDDDKFSERAIEALFPKWLQKAWDIRYNGNKETARNTFIAPANYVPVHISYNPKIQIVGADFAIFVIEQPISLNGLVNGIGFLGDEKTGKPFTQFKSLQTYNTAKDGGFISINDVYFECSGTIVKIWGNTQLKTFFLNYIPANVFNCTIYNYATQQSALFNPVIDEFPISSDILDTFLDIAARELFPEAATPADYKNDSASIQFASK